MTKIVWYWTFTCDCQLNCRFALPVLFFLICLNPCMILCFVCLVQFTQFHWAVVVLVPEVLHTIFVSFVGHDVRGFLSFLGVNQPEDFSDCDTRRMSERAGHDHWWSSHSTDFLMRDSHLPFSLFIGTWNANNINNNSFPVDSVTAQIISWGTVTQSLSLLLLRTSASLNPSCVKGYI